MDNDQYIGRICRAFGVGAVSPNWTGVFTTQIGSSFDSIYPARWCNVYKSGVSSYASFSGFRTGIATGKYLFYSFNGKEDGVYKNISGTYSGGMEFPTVSSFILNNSGSISGSGSGFMDGFFVGTISGVSGYTGQSISRFANLPVNNSRFIFNGVASGVTYNVTGNSRLLGSGALTPYTSISQSGLRSGRFVGHYEVDGFFHTEGQYTYTNYSGSRQEVTYSTRSENFNGFARHLCDSPITAGAGTYGCPDFAPLQNNCSYSGGLDVRILYPLNNSVFTINTLNPNTPSYSGREILANGDIFYPQDESKPSDPPTPDNSGAPQEGSKCPYYESENPSCTGGNDGSITFVMENTNPAECQIYPPYSGSLSYGYDLNTVDSIIYTGSGIPARLTFNDLLEGAYVFNVSGVSGSLSMPVILSAQGSFPVEYALIKKATTCMSTDSVVRFRWSGYNGAPVRWSIDDTSFGGVSSTGAFVDGLAPGSYNARLVQNSYCEAEVSFSVEEENPLEIFVSDYNGLSCTGNLTDGVIQVQATGGTAPYSYKWQNVSGTNTTNIASGLSVGFYRASVLDANGCTASVERYVSQNKGGLNVYTELTAGSPLVCCQETDTASLPKLKVIAQGGVPPYTYEWNTIPVRNTDEISGLRPGSYYCVVTDSVGCSVQTSTEEISYSSSCFKVRWTSTDGVKTQSSTFYAKPSDIPTSFPFVYDTPGDYLITLAISSPDGKTGIDCANIHVVRAAGSPNPFPNPEPGEDANPEPDDSETGGGNFPEGGETPSPSDSSSKHNTERVCCKLISAGINDRSCRTTCQDAKSCQGQNTVFGNSQQLADKPCSNCSTIWVPKAGTCCIALSQPGKDTIYTCKEIVSCDGEAACKKYITSADTTVTWTEGGTCNTASSSYSCGGSGLCCTDNGTTGKVCNEGLMSEKQCKARSGIFHNGKKKCSEVSGSTHNGKKYCSLNNGLCCLKYSDVVGVMPGACAECLETDFFSCKARVGESVNGPVKISGFTWTFIPETIDGDSPFAPGNPNRPTCGVDKYCKTSCDFCQGYDETGCDCQQRLSMGLDCCCPLNEAPTGPNGACRSMPCSDV